MKVQQCRRRTFLGLLGGTGLFVALQELQMSLGNPTYTKAGATLVEALLKKYSDDPVKLEYIRAGFVKTDHEVMQLHMFFSPHRVPSGLTRDEVRTCLTHFKLRDEQCGIFEKKYSRRFTTQIDGKPVQLEIPSGSRKGLPQQLLTNPMTRTNFAVGIEKFLQEARA